MLEHEGRSGAAIQQKSFDAPDDGLGLVITLRTFIPRRDSGP